MRRLLYISHANVSVDPEKPVPRWSLSAEGRRRHAAFSETPLARTVTRVFSSAETKAIEAAQATFPHLTGEIVVREEMHENDRSATGFLPPQEFEAVADRFFTQPELSVRGWERAIDAQRRIVGAVESALAESADHDTVAVVGHGGVGTLLFCRLASLAIDRRHDQPANGGGNVIVVEFADPIRVSPWRPMESLGSDDGAST